MVSEVAFVIYRIGNSAVAELEIAPRASAYAPGAERSVMLADIVAAARVESFVGMGRGIAVECYPTRLEVPDRPGQRDTAHVAVVNVQRQRVLRLAAPTQPFAEAILSAVASAAI